MACVVLLSCGGGDDSETVGSDTAIDFVFEGGDFQLFVKKVHDGCLDGSLDLLFMPAGTAQPYALSSRTWIPAASQLPESYEIKLQAPFSDLPVTMESDGEYAMKIADAQLPQVELGLPGGPCTADMSFSAVLALTSAGTIDMDTSVILSNFNSADELCPNLASDPCTVGLEMYGEL
jgi:hypothetical protein